jgi:hypothetical protein
MKSIKVNLMFWLAGFVAGVVLLERWRRHGGRYVPVPDGMPGDFGASSTTAPAKPRMSAAIIAGAKADAAKAKNLIKPNKNAPSEAADSFSPVTTA